MRAAGHYPSEADTDSLLAHVRFLADMAPADDAQLCSSSGGVDDGHAAVAAAASSARKAGGVDLDTFLLLYLSHRPVVDFSRQQVEAAFKTLGAATAAGAGVGVGGVELAGSGVVLRVTPWRAATKQALLLLHTMPAWTSTSQQRGQGLFQDK